MDALRGDGRQDPGAETAAATPPSKTEAVDDDGLVAARVALRAAGVPAGVLTYADEECRLHSVTLPDLEPHPGPGGRACFFRATVGGELAFGRQPPPSFDFGLRSRCGRGRLDLRLPNGDLYARAPARGCGVAWRSDGMPTFIHDGEVMRFVPCPGDALGELPLRCSRAVLSRAELTRELRRARWTRLEFFVEEVLWLDGRRFAAIVVARSVGGGTELLAVFEKGQLVSKPQVGYEDLSGIRQSPSGALVSASIVEPGGIVTVNRDGVPVRLAMRHGQALTWSPDERWIAEATADGIYVFRADDPSPVFVHIPIVASDLVWR